MSVTISKAQTQSIQAKLNNIGKKQGSTSQQMVTLFLLERTAVRLMSDDYLKNCLIFKGGYVGVRVYNSPRYTTDLDAVLRGLESIDAISRIKSAMAVEIGDGVWFQFEGSESIQAQGEYGGIGLKFRGGLGEPPAKISKAQQIHIDLGIGDPITPAPRVVSTNFTIGEGSLTWQVYSIETILAEKLHAMITLGDRNSRAKDVYDIQLFLPQANPNVLRDAIKATFTFRGDQVPAQVWEVLASIDTSVLKRGWVTAVSSIKEAAQFEATYENILEVLKSWNI